MPADGTRAADACAAGRTTVLDPPANLAFLYRPGDGGSGIWLGAGVTAHPKSTINPTLMVGVDVPRA